VNREQDFLLDIVELIESINRHRPDTVEDFVGNEVLLAAVIHWEQSLGDAANAVSVATRSSYPDVSCRQVVVNRDLAGSWLSIRGPSDCVAGGSGGSAQAGGSVPWDSRRHRRRRVKIAESGRLR